MKKLIYTSIALLAAGSASMAQGLVQGRPGHKVDHTSIPQSPVKNNTLGKADIQEWYVPSDWLNAFTGGGSTLSTFVDFLMPDSQAVYINSGDTAVRFYSIAVGQVIDPTDKVIDNSDNPGIKMSKFSSYRLDSFDLQYIYVRNVDSIVNPNTSNMEKVVDTLIVSYLVNGNGLTKNTTPIGTAPNQFNYTLPSWNINTLKLNTLVGQEKFLLTSDDSTVVLNNNGFENSWRLKNMSKKVGVNVDVPAGLNLMVGIIFQFKPGMPYTDSSIIIYQRDPANFPVGRKRVNYFGYRFAQNTASINNQWRSLEYYNHALYSDKENAYYASSSTINNGWTGFIPGNAYFEGRTNFMSVNLDAKKVGGKESELVSITNLYPNPATDETNVNIDLKKSGNVTVSIVNLIGQEVNAVNAGTLNAGNNNIKLNLGSLKAGIYFINVDVDGSTTTKKLTVTR